MGTLFEAYAGISHVGELSGGRRVDFAVMPGLYRRSYSVPNVLYESGYHPWRVDPQMRDITYRFDLEWKDRVYVDVTYHVLDSLRVLVGAACVNNTDLPQNILLHNVVWTSYDDDYPRAEAVNTAGTTVRYGCDYTSFEPAVADTTTHWSTTAGCAARRVTDVLSAAASCGISAAIPATASNTASPLPKPAPKGVSPCAASWRRAAGPA